MIDIPFHMIKQSFALDFEPAAHNYTYLGRPMDSVTTVLKSYRREFDAPAKAIEIAAREDSTQTAPQILASWDTKKTAAIETGNLAHAEAERVAWELQTSGRFYSPNPTDNPKVAAVHSWYLSHFETTQGYLIPELRICLPSHSIAGTVDLIASNYEGIPTIIDWKTNARLSIHAPSNLLPPFQRGRLKLPDSQFWIYALQLNLYRRILQTRYDYNAELLMLVHLRRDGSFDEIPIPIMDEHIDRILEQREAKVQ